MFYIENISLLCSTTKKQRASYEVPKWGKLSHRRSLSFKVWLWSIVGHFGLFLKFQTPGCSVGKDVLCNKMSFSQGSPCALFSCSSFRPSTLNFALSIIFINQRRSHEVSSHPCFARCLSSLFESCYCGVFSCCHKALNPKPWFQG